MEFFFLLFLYTELYTYLIWIFICIHPIAYNY